ncbi:Rubrerythrin [Desulfocicer vacuolatum DSM 3385]|nr:Rubrerythrin [Desulfocicer vacuolatum DSM 3385]
MMAGKGFENVINVAGGFKAWKGHAAVGSQDLGVELFDGSESPEETLVVAYSLEQGLREYYLSMVKKVKNTQVQEIFSLLAEIEVKHQERLFQQYLELSDTNPTLEAFENEIVVNAVEGGMSTDEYAKLYNPDWESPVDVISIAMAIEAQALDMYQRTAAKVGNEKSREILTQIAREERSHLEELGKLMDRI